MSEHGRPARVGVRELRQNLSVYLDRVKDGETLEVTEHGQPVARLEPLPPGRQSSYERLVAEGRIIPAKGTLSAALDLPALELPSGAKTLTQVLLEMRDEESW